MNSFKSTLGFQSGSAQAREEPLHLTIWGPKNNQKFDYPWNEETTTLDMLLNDVIKAFDLESVERHRIRLVTISDAEIDLLNNSHVRLSSLGHKNGSILWIKLIDLSGQENIRIHIKCINFNDMSPIYVSPTNTIAQVKKKIESCLVIVHELYTETNKMLDLNDYLRTLKGLGVQSNQIIYAKLHLSVIRQPSNEVQSSSLPVARQHKVIIKCKLSSSKTVHIIASVKDTVAELTEKIASYKKDQSLAQFLLRSGTVVIDDTQPTLSLADFGIKPGSTIEAQLIEFNPNDNSDRNMPTISRHILPIGLKNQNNSCFMNSALQCLIHVMPLTEYFLKSYDPTQRNTNNSFDSHGKVTRAYAKLIRKFQLTDHSDNALTPIRLRTAISVLYPPFATEDQQDAQEFLSALLSAIHEDFHSNNQSKQKTIIEKLFFAKIRSMTTCLRCNHVKKNVEILQLIPLPLIRQQRKFNIEFHSKNGRQSRSSVPVVASGSIEHLVKAFVDQQRKKDLFNRIIVQTIETDESVDFSSPLYMLTDSKVKFIENKKYINRTEPIQLETDPKKMTLYQCLREFIAIEYLKDEWHCEQIECDKKSKVVKQLQFCTLPPVLIIQLKRFASENGQQKKIKTFVEYPIDGLDLRDSSTSQDAIYDLIAVSNHMGSIGSGHYTACARQKLPRDQWYKFDDDKVSIIYSDFEIVTANAYLLFYIRRNYRLKY